MRRYGIPILGKELIRGLGFRVQGILLDPKRLLPAAPDNYQYYSAAVAAAAAPAAAAAATKECF